MNPSIKTHSWKTYYMPGTMVSTQNSALCWFSGISPEVMLTALENRGAETESTAESQFLQRKYEGGRIHSRQNRLKAEKYGMVFLGSGAWGGIGGRKMDKASSLFAKSCPSLSTYLSSIYLCTYVSIYIRINHPSISVIYPYLSIYIIIIYLSSLLPI